MKIKIIEVPTTLNTITVLKILKIVVPLPKADELNGLAQKCFNYIYLYSLTRRHFFFFKY